MNRSSSIIDSSQTEPNAAAVAGIVREVVRRLRRDRASAETFGLGENLPATNQPSASQPVTAHECNDAVVSLESLTGFSLGRVVILGDAVITPSAKEYAAANKIDLVRGESASETGCPLATQLVRRGIKLPASTRVKWTDDPATAVFEECAAGVRAVMVTQLSDLDRFRTQFGPQVWVLDRQRLSLAAAVHIASRIAKPSRSGGTR
ncbi:MAG: hypothetical protein AAFV88_13225 [Planctomycetota bacterium]